MRAERSPISMRTGAERPRRGVRRTVMGTIRQLPNYMKLLFGLMRDSRVSAMDKLLVAGAIAYVLMPFDLIPDFIPFFGEVDDVFLLLTSLQRLIANAGRDVLLDHWAGDPDDLADLSIKRAVGAASFFLPAVIKGKLLRMVKRRR